MNRLKAYVRRTITQAARDDTPNGKRRTQDSTRSACMSAMNGVDTGWWNDMIYTADRLDMFNRYRVDVADTIRDYINETGTNIGDQVRVGDPMTYADMLAATARRWTWQDYTQDDYTPRANGALAATYAIGFAVEVMASDVCRDLCPDL